jgi:hypothetical protein
MPKQTISESMKSIYSMFLRQSQSKADEVVRNANGRWHIHLESVVVLVNTKTIMRRKNNLGFAL